VVGCGAKGWSVSGKDCLWGWSVKVDWVKKESMSGVVHYISFVKRTGGRAFRHISTASV
jgi:hypothetical protein